MSKKGIAFGLTVFLLYSGMTAWAEEASPMMASERLLAHIDFSSWAPKSFEVSPDGSHVAYGSKVNNKWVVVVDGKEGKQYDTIMEGTPIFSPDSKRVAYVAETGGKCFLVVDEKEGKPYDLIMKGTLVFSPDSTRLAYVARTGKKWCVVVNGKEAKQYDGIVTIGGGRIIFDSAESLHYLAQEGTDIYLVEMLK